MNACAAVSMYLSSRVLNCCSTDLSTAVAEVTSASERLSTAGAWKDSSSLRFATIAMCNSLRRWTSCSRVSPLRHMLTRRGMTMTPSSTRGSPMTSRQLSGGKSTSLSPGYCDTQQRSAPISMRPTAISSTVPRSLSDPEYCIATWRSIVADIRPLSTPPRKPSVLIQKESGRSIPPSPRYTRLSSGTSVSFESFTMPLIMQKMVVSYRLPDSDSQRSSGNPRRTALYQMYMGPV